MRLTSQKMIERGLRLRVVHHYWAHIIKEKDAWQLSTLVPSTVELPLVVGHRVLVRLDLLLAKRVVDGWDHLDEVLRTAT